ncbi:MAG: hypothetical protein ABIS84_05300 [Arachnia sp.]
MKKIPAALVVAVVALSGCASPAPPEEPSQVAKLVFGSDYRGVEESPSTSLEGDYSLDADCAGGTGVVVAILVDREEVRRVSIPCSGVSSTPVAFDSPVAEGAVTLEVVSGTGEGSVALTSLLT